MLKVTNKTKEERKFRDTYKGSDVIVPPGETIITDHPPAEIDVWKVEPAEKIEEKKTPVKKISSKEEAE